MRLRLTVLSVLAALVLVGAGVAFTYLLIGRQLVSHLQEDVAAELQQYEDALPALTDADGLVQATREYLDGPAAQSLRERGMVFALLLPGDRVLSTPSDLALETFPSFRSLLTGQEGMVTQVEGPGGRYVLGGRSVVIGGAVAAAAGVAAPLAPVAAVQRQVLWVLVLAGLVAVTAVGAGFWLVIGRALEPVRRMSEAAEEITRRDLARRLEYRGPADEIGSLATTLNRMLDRLETSFEAQDRFISDVSHELRTPLTIIKGHLQMLAKEEAPDWPHVQQEHRLVLEQLDRLNRLVGELLRLARLQRSDVLEWNDFPLGEFLETLVEHGGFLAERAWALEGRVAGSRGEPVLVHADKDRLTQAMLNLMQNAVRHTEEGQTIAVGGDFNRETVRLWVRDEGMGIAPEVRERMMERFVRGSAEGEPGLGLGLAIVKAVAEAHGGAVEVESRDGSGALFTLVLPRP